ncbi:alpha/beta fold hydrolase [Streptomyces sp. NPDC087420]|uniref:alpha/beta fold hydrolase n=1 Tax=Streptomyces sp. NPDC087420 TaxID=3365785 RepID=UPI0038324124
MSGNAATPENAHTPENAPGDSRRWTRKRMVVPALLALTVLVVPVVATAASATPEAPARVSTTAKAPASTTAKPTVVLVHGAFADASSWDGVVKRLQRQGYPVVAVANPLRDLGGDSAYTSSVLDGIPGPVVLVGHSYGGEVITNAAVGHPNVKALVYVAAYAPDQGESGLTLTGKFPGSRLGANLVTHAFPVPGGGSDVEGTVNPVAFHEVFAGDLPKSRAAAMAATQRPVALAALGTPSGVPAWRTIPSWYLVAGSDLAIPAAAERFMAKRAGAHTIEIKGASHVVMMSHPDRTTDLITAAAKATS